jgi:hypothetical protein
MTLEVEVAQEPSALLLAHLIDTLPMADGLFRIRQQSNGRLAAAP